jgi:2-polyprenyl-3-methyl-5-hydroxy-6-metoxy-1,4-benzoquinol methylase
MKKKSIAQFYDVKYNAYQHPAPETVLERLYVLLKKFELHRNDAAISLLTPATKILDIGAGYGHLLLKAQTKGFKQLYGIDISPVVVRHCQAELDKAGVNAKISCQNIDVGTTFKTGFFDAVTMVAVFEHIFSPHDVLKEISRILKKGGELVIEVPNVAFLPRRLDFIRGKLPKTSDEPSYLDGHLQFFTQESLIKLLQAHSFHILYTGSSGIFSSLRNLWPQLLGANIVIKAVKQ